MVFNTCRSSSPLVPGRALVVAPFFYLSITYHLVEHVAKRITLLPNLHDP